MKYVEIYSFTSGKQIVVGCVELANEEVTFKGLSRKFVDPLLEDGIVIGGKTVFPEDGLDFLKALEYQFSGSMTRASKVLEEK